MVSHRIFPDTQMFSKGKSNPEVAIKLVIPQTQVTQFRLEYWRLQDQDDLESLQILTKGKQDVCGNYTGS
ncbi:MAG: hypothetical protein QOK63_10860 [Nitrososphaeraceae archaeon]|nr:hypothetical protein [Nitrososphaeraceae archaeon]MDW0340469.1 hypothetical protein [Nitrososphaeraceae archaeon]